MPPKKTLGKRKVIRNFSSRFPRGAKIMEESNPISVYLQAHPVQEERKEVKGDSAQDDDDDFVEPPKKVARKIEPIDLTDDDHPSASVRASTDPDSDFRGGQSFPSSPPTLVRTDGAEIMNRLRASDSFAQPVPKYPASMGLGGTSAGGAGSGDIFKPRTEPKAVPKKKTEKKSEPLAYDQVDIDSLIDLVRGWENVFGTLVGMRKDLALRMQKLNEKKLAEMLG